MIKMKAPKGWHYDRVFFKLYICQYVCTLVRDDRQTET